MGLILISSVAWGSCLFEWDTLRVVRPAQLLFPAYEEEVLTKVRLSNFASWARIFDIVDRGVAVKFKMCNARHSSFT